jgi:hypothetical protein
VAKKKAFVDLFVLPAATSDMLAVLTSRVNAIA